MTEGEALQKLQARAEFLEATIEEWREQAEVFRKAQDELRANRWLAFTNRELDRLALDIDVAHSHHVPGLHPPLDMHLYDEIRAEIERRRRSQ